MTTTTIRELVRVYLDGDPALAWRGKRAEFAPDARGHSEATNIDYALRHLLAVSVELPAGDAAATRHGMGVSSRHLADLPPDELRPSDLRHVQQRLVTLARARTYVNRVVKRVVQLYEWAVGYELAKPETLRALECVAPVRRGMPGVREKPRIPAASPDAFERAFHCAPWLLRQAMIVQSRTGMRPGELIAMRCCDLHLAVADDAVLWEYRPPRHKTAHLGCNRIIPIGPEAQDAIRKVVDFMYGEAALIEGTVRGVPKLGDAADDRPLFHRGRLGWRSANSYSKSIGRAAARAGVTMTSNQLRKLAANTAFLRADLDTASKLLGHTDSKTTRAHYIDRAVLDHKEGEKARQWALDFG